MIVDTDVLIWYLRGNKKAVTALNNRSGILISVVSYIELIQGVRNKKELNNIRLFIKDLPADIIHVNDEISSRTLLYVERYILSHSVELADALIAASAVVYGVPLLTSNDKHYRPITDVEILRFKP